MLYCSPVYKTSSPSVAKARQESRTSISPPAGEKKEDPHEEAVPAEQSGSSQFSTRQLLETFTCVCRAKRQRRFSEGTTQIKLSCVMSDSLVVKESGTKQMESLVAGKFVSFL